MDTSLKFSPTLDCFSVSVFHVQNCQTIIIIYYPGNSENVALCNVLRRKDPWWTTCSHIAFVLRLSATRNIMAFSSFSALVDLVYSGGSRQFVVQVRRVVCDKMGETFATRVIEGSSLKNESIMMCNICSISFAGWRKYHARRQWYLKKFHLQLFFAETQNYFHILCIHVFWSFHNRVNILQSICRYSDHSRCISVRRKWNDPWTTGKCVCRAYAKCNMPIFTCLAVYVCI